MVTVKKLTFKTNSDQDSGQQNPKSFDTTQTFHSDRFKYGLNCTCTNKTHNGTDDIGLNRFTKTV